jgi:tripeptide aminopeptidase
MPLFTRIPSGADDRETLARMVAVAQKEVARLAELREVHAAFAWFRSHERELQDLQLEVTAIAAPPFGEERRGQWLAQQFEAVGLSDVHRDEVGNVFGTRAGTGTESKYVAVTAHIDTVFPPGTPIHVRREGDKLFGPGISDNSSGIIALLALAAAMRDSEIQNHAPVVFIGNVGEEGEGDLRGYRHIFGQEKWRESISQVIAIDGAGVDSIVAEALGSRRFEVTISGPGGHSWSDFGLPNPIVVLGRVIDRFSRTPIPVVPKTTFNVGVISGGTSVNSIPQSATMRVDLRSADAREIDRLEQELRSAVEQTVIQAEAESYSERRVLSYGIQCVGNRPAADLPLSARLLHVVQAVDAHLNNVAKIHRASTDANIPLSLGIEAVALGAGGMGGSAHTVQEWYDPRGRDLGLKRNLLATLTLTGVAE